MKNTIKHQGEINLNGFIIPCYVLEDGTRILSTTGMQKALGVIDNEPNQRSSGRLDEILSSKAVKPYLSGDLNSSEYDPIPCYNGKQKISGYLATLLPDICEAILKARDSGIPLGTRQQTVVKQAELLLRAFARLGIIALVDEATGYQYEREKNELQKILKAYISPELLPWEKRFPDEFYREIFRLRGWYFTTPEINKGERPGVIGKWTKDYIYSVLPKGVLQALLIKTPRGTDGRLVTKLHQRLTREQGIEHLNKLLISVVTLMNISDNWNEFHKLWNKKFGQQTLDLETQKLIDAPIKAMPELSDFNKKLITAIENNSK